MNKLAPLFAAIALALSGGVLANTAHNTDRSQSSAPSAGNSLPDAGSQSPKDSQTPIPGSSAAKPPEGFVVLQRNIYVPVDAEGKIASNEWVVVEREGYVTAEEVKAAQAETGTGGESADSNGKGGGPKGERAPKLEEPAPSPSPHTAPSRKDALPDDRGPLITS